MRLARIVYGLAAAYGLITLVPLLFSSRQGGS
jgi:hypothetical protein